MNRRGDADAGQAKTEEASDDEDPNNHEDIPTRQSPCDDDDSIEPTPDWSP
jgi:hypothetical protein